eukprot:5536946-Alexandrium_andersonii.AAC.1
MRRLGKRHCARTGHAAACLCHPRDSWGFCGFTRSVVSTSWGLQPRPAGRVGDSGARGRCTASTR